MQVSQHPQTVVGAVCAAASYEMHWSMSLMMSRPGVIYLGFSKTIRTMLKLLFFQVAEKGVATYLFTEIGNSWRRGGCRFLIVKGGRQYGR